MKVLSESLRGLEQIFELEYPQNNALKIRDNCSVTSKSSLESIYSKLKVYIRRFILE